MNNSFAVKADNISYLYPNHRGIRNLSLEVNHGDCVCLLGKNGSGKTTLTRLILGLLRCNEGRLIVLNRDITKNKKPLLKKMGIVQDQSVHWEKLTGRQNLYFAAGRMKRNKSDITEQMDNFFKLTGLSDQADDRVETYSFGMRRKLSLAQAMIREPDLLVLDEPTSGVDILFVQKLSEIITERKQNRKTTWIAGNDPDWIFDIATKVVFMDGGKIAASGTVNELMERISGYRKVKIHLESLIVIPEMENRDIEFSQKGNIIEGIIKDSFSISGLVSWITAHKGRISSLDIQKRTLRDVFFKITGDMLDESA